MALGVPLAARELGLRCPEDLSIVGFDNLDFAEFTAPALTTVHQSGYQLGTTAARLLLDRINGLKQPAKNMVLPTELKIRNSVAPILETAGFFPQLCLSARRNGYASRVPAARDRGQLHLASDGYSRRPAELDRRQRLGLGPSRPRVKVLRH